MSLQIQPRALDIENDFNIIQGIILNILILSQQPWRFSAKFWDAAVTTLQKLVMFFSPQLFPRNAWLKIAGSQHLVKKMMWIGFHPGAAAVFRVTIKASKTKKERGNLKCKEWWDGHVFVFFGVCQETNAIFSPYKQKFLETLRILFEHCMNHSLCSCDMFSPLLYIWNTRRILEEVQVDQTACPRGGLTSGILATYGSSKQTSHNLFGPLDFQGTDIYKACVWS